MKIGILGGIGPLSSAQLYMDVIKGLQLSGYIDSNENYPQIIINSVPAPPLTSICCTQDMLSPYILGVRELSYHQPHFIILVCNTIHFYLEKLRLAANNTPIISLQDLVYQALLKKMANKICVLATPITIKTKLYHFKEFNYYQLSEDVLVEIGAIINDYSNTGDFKKAKMKLWCLVQSLQDRQIDCFILGCTEISLLLQNTNIPYLDTMAILRDYLINRVVSYLKLKSQLRLYFDLPVKEKST